MRIAFLAGLLTGDTVGGAEIYAEDAARTLAARHEVVFITGSKAPPPDGLVTLRLPGLPLLAGGSVARKGLWHLRDQWLPGVHGRLVNHLEETNPDVVASHSIQGLSAAAFTALTRAGVPHVHTAHDLSLLCIRATMTRGGEFCGGGCASCRIQRITRTRALRPNLTRLITISDYVRRRHLEARVIDPSRAVVIPHGTRPGPARRREAPPPGTVTLGFIGMLGRHKGLPTLLEAFRRAPPGWRLVIAGTGELEPEVNALAVSDPRVSYRGRVSGQAKDDFFDALDLVVVPSEWEEPATFVATEAAIRGIPAVVSDRGGLPETPEAQVFRSGDPDALLSAVEWLTESGRIAARSAKLLAASGAFTWERHMGRVEEVLTDAANEAAAA
jgi:glycosyltransferase involved in cell wall biosynthesis